MLLDLHTVFIVCSSLTVITGICMVLVQLTGQPYPGFRFWTWAVLCQGVSYSSFAYSQQLPPLLVTVVGNLLYCAHSMLYNSGLRAFAGRQARLLSPVLGLAYIAVVTYYFTFIHASMVGRVGAIALCTVPFYFDCARVIWREDAFRNRLIRPWLAGAFVLLVVFAVGRLGLMVVLERSRVEVWAPSQIQPFYVMIDTAISITVVIGVIVLNFERAAVGLKEHERLLTEDVAARKRVEAALRESEFFFKESQQAAFIGSYKTDLVAGCWQSSEVLDQIFGIDQRYGRSISGWLDLVHPEDQPMMGRYLDDEVIAKRRPFDKEYRIIRKSDGEVRWVNGTGKVSFDADGKAVSLIGTIQDITERRRAELMQTAHYKISEAVFRTEDLRALLRRIHEIVGELLPARNFYVALHDSTTDLLSFPYFVDEFDAPPASRLPSSGLTAMVLRTGKPLQLTSEMLKDMVPAGKITVGGTLPSDWLGVPLASRARTIGVLAIQSYSGSVRYGERDRDLLQFVSRQIADAIERKQAEADREMLQSQLTQAQKMESVGRLAGGVAHDFNNMLTAIQGNVGLALEGLPPGSPLRENLEEIRQCAHRSAELTRQLLAFARKQTVTPRLLDLNSTVEGTLKMLRRIIGEDIDLQWRPATGLRLVLVDPSQIDQVLANLCVNARDAISGEGTIVMGSANAVVDDAYRATHPDVSLGDYVVLTVSDNGCGMGKEVLRHLFEPFFTTKGIGQGTGLGLATVYGIVTQNGGFIDVSSEPGKGATFKIYWPAKSGTAAQLEAGVTGIPAERGHETILLVEDEPTILRVGKLMLERLGYTVVAAATPSEAVRLAASHTGEIHLLLTDVVMPEMNGRELAKGLLSLYPKLKRVFMSGYTANVIGTEGVDEAGIHFIQKPFSTETLAKKVRFALDEV